MDNSSYGTGDSTDSYGGIFSSLLNAASIAYSAANAAGAAKPAATAAPTTTASAASLTGYLPWLIGGVVVVAVFVFGFSFLGKRKG